MADQEQLEKAITHLESQRPILGDAAVDAAIEGLKRKISNNEDVVSSLKGERKLVTIMFADISGFTALAEKMDPEAIRDIANSCFEELVPRIEKYEGTVDKFIGDGLMALFGAPVTHENDPERALRAALEMMDALEDFNRARRLNLGMHFGINTGLVIAGDIGAGQQHEYSVLGDAVNLASRLEDLSPRGEIFVGPDTYRLTANIFDFVALDPIQVKGKAKPVHIYRLEGIESDPKVIHSLGSREISSALVGRDTEVAQITDHIQKLLTGWGSVLSVVGEAGVGKSRLLSEIRASVDTNGLTWLEGRTLSFGQTISFLPFQGILWDYIGITDDDSEVQTWKKLERVIAALFPDEVPEILPYLATLLSIEVREDYDERVKYLDGEAMSRQIFLVMKRFFRRITEERPLMLVFEDLHWVDKSSALLLEHLLSLTEEAPLLIIGISRPYQETPAFDLQQFVRKNVASRYTEIDLSPLSQAQSTQLIQNLLTTDNVSTKVISMIVRKAEGNPFFIEEIIRSLVDRGAVVYDSASQRWKATNLIDAINIPDTVQGVVMARVDRLDSPTKHVLSSAAAVGRTFLYRVLSAVESGNRQLDDHLVELQAIELINEKQQIPELEYIFKNALVQEAIYESILLQTRRDIHKRVGQVIERLFEDRLDEFYGVLAYHYARAEAWEKAQGYLLKAGDQAGRIAADSEALAHYQQAMSIFERTYNKEWDPVERAVLERKVGEALFRRGEHTQALEYLHRSLEFFGNPLPETRLGVQLAILREVLKQFGRYLLPRLLGFTRETLAEMDQSGDTAVEEEIHLYELIAWIEALRSQENFLLVALKTSNVSEQKKNHLGIVVGSTALGLVCDFIPAFKLAGNYHHRAMTLAEHMQHPSLLGLAYTGLNIHSSYLAEWDSAIEAARRAVDIYQDTGNLHNQGQAFYGLGANFGYMGDYPQALEYSREAIRLGEEGNDLQVQCWGMMREGFSLRRQGQLNEASKTLRSSFELAKSISDYATQIEVGGELARCFLNQGELETALSLLNEIQQVFLDHGAVGGTNTPLRNGLAEAYLMAMEQDKPIQGNDDWTGKAKQACQVALKQGKAFYPGMPDALRMRGTFEWLVGKHLAAKKWWQRSLAVAIEQRQRYDAGMALLEMGQRMQDRNYLEKAEAIFKEIGAEWCLNKTRHLLEQI